MNIQKWIDKNTFSLSGKVVAVTGSTGGLGSNLCLYLLGLGADLIMLDRNTEKSLALKEKLLSKFPNAKIDNIKLDLSDIENIKEVSRKLKNQNIDFLVLNAGVYNVPVKKLDIGYNNIFQVNFISPYFLVKSLMPNLRKNHAKVIAVSSIAHKSAKLNEDDIDYSRVKSASKVYGNSKRFLMFALFELFKNETEVTLSAAHPGVTPTAMTTHYHWSINWLVKGGMKILFPPPQTAALNLLLAIFSNCDYHEWIGPSRFDVWGKPKLKKLKTCGQKECEKIYNLAEKIYNDIVKIV